MQLIVDDLVQDKKFHKHNAWYHKLVIIGADPVPIEISEGGGVISWADLATSHEDADNVIVQQVLSCAAENAESKSLLLPMTLMSLYCCCIIITWQILRMLTSY